MNKIAIIDMGTNTFQLLIAGVENGLRIVREEKTGVRLGADHFKNNQINREAAERAIDALGAFSSIIEEEIAIQTTIAIGTSAFRNAKNGRELIEEWREKFPFEFMIISGKEEAELIHQGILTCYHDVENDIIMDIGGGSVEFILTSEDGLIVKSYDVGVQRLLSRFSPSDPIKEDEIGQIFDYLSLELSEITELINLHKCKRIIGSAGTFDTVRDLFEEDTGAVDSCFREIPLSNFHDIYKKIISSTHEERIQMKGIPTLRIDMIVTALCLIQFVLNSRQFNSIVTARYSLKEGAAVIYGENITK